jgi:hypothetical protein
MKAALASQAKGGKLTVKDTLTGKSYTKLVNAKQGLSAMNAADADKGLAILSGETVRVSTKVVTDDGIRSLTQDVTLPPVADK